MTLVLAFVLFLVFVLLEATGAIEWSSVAVTSPLWLWGLASLIVLAEATFWRFVRKGKS